VDGGVLVRAGRVVAVDRFQRLRAETSRVVELEGRILTPALINCHAHLELSHLAELGQQPPRPPGEMPTWIAELLAKRGQAVEPQTIPMAGKEALTSLHRRGVAVVCDLGNDRASQTIADGGRAQTLFFHELLGATTKAAEAALAASPPEAQVTAHAPYSCHPSLLQGLKARARQRRRLFPIHVAESAEEVEFLQTGGGPFAPFFSERLRLAGVMARDQALAEVLTVPGCRAVEYLHRLHLLDHRTLCVHCVHLTDHERETLAQTGAKVCLCPGSNRRLGVGKAQIMPLIDRQILPGLGTDSLASNDCLDLWREMQIVTEDHPELPAELIFRMATLAGAEALGVDGHWGALAPGRQADLLAVAYEGPAAGVLPFLVSSGQDITLNWLEGDCV